MRNKAPNIPTSSNRYSKLKVDVGLLAGNTGFAGLNLGFVINQPNLFNGAMLALHIGSTKYFSSQVKKSVKDYSNAKVVEELASRKRSLGREIG